MFESLAFTEIYFEKSELHELRPHDFIIKIVLILDGLMSKINIEQALLVPLGCDLYGEVVCLLRW